MPQESVNDALRSSIPWITLSAAVALTFAGWVGIERSRTDQARAQFDHHVQAVETAIRTRMLTNEQIVRAGAAHVAATPNLTRKGWHDFVAQMRIDQYPGLQAIAFAESVAAGAKRAHVRRMRAEGLRDYEIAPNGERSQYFPVVFNEPHAERNLRMLGFDPYAEPARRSVMERARDTGQAAISPRLALAGDVYSTAKPQAGFAMYFPVFRGDPPETTEARVRSLGGFVVAVFRMGDLMRGIVDASAIETLDLRIYDGAPDVAAAQLLDTRAAWRDAQGPFAPLFTRRVILPAAGRTWTIVFASRPEFDAAADASRPWGVLASGLLASALLFVLTVTLVATWNRAHQLSMRDPLTGLYNRRYLDETIGRELPRARRQHENVGVIALDIDHFKRLNDSFGHDAGDFVLRSLAEQIRAATRDSDIACRFGGEEFGIILPGASLSVARERAEGLRIAVEALRLEFDGKPLGSFTISAGVASMPPHAQDWSFTLQTADRALYAAKEQGRNRVVAAT